MSIIGHDSVGPIVRSEMGANGFNLLTADEAVSQSGHKATLSRSDKQGFEPDQRVNIYASWNNIYHMARDPMMRV